MPKVKDKGVNKGNRRVNVRVHHHSVDRKFLNSTEAKAKMFSHYCQKNATYTPKQWFIMEHSILHFIEHLVMTRLRHQSFPPDLDFLKAMTYAKEPSEHAKVYVNEHYHCAEMREWIRRAFERYLNYYSQASEAFPEILGADLIHCHFGFSDNGASYTYSWCTETKQKLIDACRRTVLRPDYSCVDDPDIESSARVHSTIGKGSSSAGKSTRSGLPQPPELNNNNWDELCCGDCPE